MITYAIIMAMVWGCTTLGQVMAKQEQDEGIASVSRWAFRGTAATLIVLAFITTLAASLHQVEAGHVGVVYEFGAIKDQTSDGMVVTAPWREVKRANTQVQTLCFVDDETVCPDGATKVALGLDSFSSETQNVYIDTIMNIEVSPDEVQELYRNVGPNYVNKLIPGRVEQIFKNETVKYAAVDIAPSREVISHSVTELLRKELAPFSIDVRAVLLKNISFDPAFQAAIEAKQEASQNALREQENIKAEEAKAKQQAASAQGAADRIRIEAASQAEANRLLSESLTPTLVQYEAIKKLNPNVQTIIVPEGGNIFLNVDKLQGAAAVTE